MSLRRLPDPPRRSRRLVVCGVTAALLVVPGVAHAAPGAPALPTDPASVAQQLEGQLQDGRDALGQVLPIPTLPLPTGSLPLPTGAPGTTTGTTPTSTPPDLGPLQGLFAALGVSEQCTTAVTGDLVAIVSSVPATVEALVGQLQSGLTDALADPPTDPTEFSDYLMGLIGQVTDTAVDPQGLPLITAVQDLVTDFLENCLPTPPAPSSTAPATLAPAAQQTTPPPAAPSATTPAAPVAYLGYAPTGVDTDDSGAGTPLLALGGLLLLGGGVAGTWMRLRRGVSSRG